ncbi:MAG: glycosyltransferase, partial [Acidobacteriaceae bacterium]|nr:glycosyltransferase [Acidobacteriaceae bacterium]
ARDLAAKLSELLHDPEKCKQFGRAGRKRVEETFSWSAIADQTIQLYRRLVEDLNPSKGGPSLQV